MLNISFIGYNGHEVLNQLMDTAASTGSVCHSSKTTISPVLEAMGVSDEVGRGAVRFSLGSYTTKEELAVVISKSERVII